MTAGTPGHDCEILVIFVTDVRMADHGRVSQETLLMGQRGQKENSALGRGTSGDGRGTGKQACGHTGSGLSIQ